MSDPTFVRLGNLRLAGLPFRGWPNDVFSLGELVRSAIISQPATPPAAVYGPLSLWFSQAPDGVSSAQWEGSLGWAMTGMLAPGAALADGRRLLVEDYRNLMAYEAPHPGPVGDLSRNYAALVTVATQAGRRLRPYWRVGLPNRRLADGNLLPSTFLQVFVEP